MGWRATALGIGVVLAAAPAPAEPIRVATWNLFNLHHVLGEPLRQGAVARSAEDFARLGQVRDLLDADVVALQEVNGPLAARRVFPEESWELHFSGRYVADLAGAAASDRIYVGFAVRRGVFDAVARRDVPELGVATGEAGRGLRWGTELLVQRGAASLRLLVVHLKSGCHAGRLRTPRNDACDTLARQRAPLEAWIDSAARGPLPFVVLGDFNRRFDLHGADDDLWGEIDDGHPQALDLHRLPFERESDCWRGTPRHHPQPIDFLVFDARAWQRVVPGSFRELDYPAGLRDVARGTPSDHCPLRVDLEL